MSSIIHMIEEERKFFINGGRKFLYEITYHLQVNDNYSRAEFEDYMVITMLNSRLGGTIMKAFMKLIRHKRMVMKQHG